MPASIGSRAKLRPSILDGSTVEKVPESRVPVIEEPRYSMEPSPQRFAAFLEQASDEELLDRVTAYRAGMTLDAIGAIEEELLSRGVNEREIQRWLATGESRWVRDETGIAFSCEKCQRPATRQIRGWRRWRPGFGRFRLPWGVPLFPANIFLCDKHAEQ